MSSSRFGVNTIVQQLIPLLRWLGLAELTAELTGLRGLSWGERGAWVLPLLLAGQRRSSVLAQVLGLVLAVPTQLGLATLRRRRLDPLLQLEVGEYRDRTITRLDVLGPHGAVPALYITPRTEALAAICVVHGSGCDKTFYGWRLVDALIARGLAVLLVDLDGHGESPRPQDYPAILGAVSGPVRWLRERHERVGVLGMSLGGAVATAAIAAGTHVDALAIWASPPRLRLDAKAYRRVVRQEALRLATPALIHLLRDSSIEHLVRAWKTSGIRARIGTWDLFDALDLLGSLGTIRALPEAQRPALLLVYGGRDVIVGRAAAEEVRAATADWAEFELQRWASHISLPNETWTIERSTSWLAQQLAPSEQVRYNRRDVGW
jgi:pimeloyl-ACP methyl ester carboxylesterase